MMMLVIVKPAINDHTVEETRSFFLFIKARARMMRTKVNLTPILALSMRGHLAGSWE